MKVAANLGLVVACVAMTSNQVNAETVDVLATAFGARENISDISIAPDGGKVAIVQPAGERGDADLVAGGAAKPIFSVTREGQRITNCKWPSDDQIVCTITVSQKGTGQVLTYSRLVGLSTAGKKAIMLTDDGDAYSRGFTFFGGAVIDWQGARPGEVLMLRQFVPNTNTGSRIGSSGKGLGVESVDPSTARRSIVERPVGQAVDYISDGSGTVRLMGINPSSGSGYDKTFIDYSYRKAGERDWSALSRASYTSTGSWNGFLPKAVDPALNAAYGLENFEGFTALYRVKLDGSGFKEKVLSRPGVDIDGLVRLGRSQRVVGGSYSAEYRMVDFFDPKLAALRTSLAKALPGNPTVTFVDASADESKLVMFVGSDIDPGRYYVLDKGTRKLEELAPLRAQLVGRKLAEMKPIQFPAADGTMIPGYLTLPPGSNGKALPAIVMPHGGPSSRDEWGFDWLVQFYAARGFAVLQPNYRGSAGYGENWFEKNGYQSWRTAVGDVDDAGRWLVATGIAAKDKLAIVGWSYGGYAALQSGVLDPGLYKAIVAIAPVTDLELLRQQSLNFTNYRFVDKQIGNGPHVTQGSPAQNVAAIQVPVLMFHGDWDTNVDIEQSRRMESRLRGADKTVELVTFPGLDHQLIESRARTAMLKRSDAFLRTALAMPAD